MEKDDFKTTVIFRKDKLGVFALFPYLIETKEGHCLSYAYLGQHSGADYSHCITASAPAKISEYLPLLRELEWLGYNLDIRTRRNHKRYLAAYHNAK